MANEFNIVNLGTPPTGQGSVSSSVRKTQEAGSVERPSQVGPDLRPVDPGKASAEQEAQAETDDKQLDEVVSELNGLAQELRRELQFSVDEDSGELVIKVKDMETDEVIRQIPSKEVLELRKRMDEAAGVIFRGLA